MHFRKGNASDQVAGHVQQSIGTALRANKRVLWLVSGGSAIGIAVDALKKLRQDTVPLDNLMVMQIDERYGPVGHDDSNWKQLQDRGFLDEDFARSPILNGESLEDTRRNYERVLGEALQYADYSIGLLGIGADGHTAGILPETEGADENAPLVVAYSAADYTRITISAKAIARLDTVIAYASGATKEDALRTLQRDVPFAEQPAQILKSVKDSYVYNDIVEGEI
jgi:6-phosphogluconolactonase